MAMNWLHRRCCSSARWATLVQGQLIPWALADVDLGDNVLEIGPGYGANLRALVDKTPRYTAVEIDGQLAHRLRDTYGGRARVITGDGTDTGLPADEFSAVVCFTMLHHVPTAALQDRLFAEALRVLRPGGVFAGSDSATSLRFRLLHVRDTCNPVLPRYPPPAFAHRGLSRRACLRRRKQIALARSQNLNASRARATMACGRPRSRAELTRTSRQPRHCSLTVRSMSFARMRESVQCCAPSYSTPTSMRSRPMSMR